MEPKCESDTTKTEDLSEGIPITLKVLTSTSDNGFCQLTVDGKEYQLTEEDENESISDNENEPLNFASSCNTYEIKSKRFAINKSMLTFRITQALWYGAGSLPSLFLSIFIMQRGLTLIEISSVYSIVFIFQFLACSMTGIITDKIGNAKPVLMFLMLSTCAVLVSMSLTPNIESETCSQKYTEINETDYLDNRNFTLCYMNCLYNDKNLDSYKENFLTHPAFKFSSNHKTIDSGINDTKTVCNFSDAITNKSMDYLENECCSICINTPKLDCSTTRNVNLVIVYAILVIAFYSVWNTSFRIMNFTAASLAIENCSNFGKEYIFAYFGIVTTLIAASFVLNVDNSSSSQISFDPVIWFTACMAGLSCLALFFTDVPILPPGRHLFKKAFNLMSDIDILAFILLVFLAGNGFAFLFTFHLVFLESINAPRILVSIHSVTIALYGLLILFTSEWWLKKFGTNKLFVLSIFFFAVYFIGCSFIQNSWWILILDICTAFSVDLFWVAVVVHCCNVAPVGFRATLTAVTGAVHFGIGRSSGVFLGGLMINYMGLRRTFRLMASVFLVAAISYSIFFYRRRTSTASNIIENGSGNTRKGISETANNENI